jgi:hypothetical protein
MARYYIILGTVLCLLTAYANFSGWKLLSVTNAAWAPKGAGQGSSFQHK